MPLADSLPAELDRRLQQALTSSGAPFERTGPGEYLVRLEGQHRLNTALWLSLNRHTLVAEAFFMRRPDEAPQELYRFLLQRNATMYGVHFCIDGVGDVYLMGRLPLSAVSPEEVDRLLGCVLTYSDDLFDPAVQLGFAGAIHRELEWRRARGLSADNLRRYLDVDAPSETSGHPPANRPPESE